MKRIALCAALLTFFLVGVATAATEETKQTAIDNGLAWLAANQIVVGNEGHWAYNNNGELAATASAAATCS